MMAAITSIDPMIANPFNYLVQLWSNNSKRSNEKIRYINDTTTREKRTSFMDFLIEKTIDKKVAKIDALSKPAVYINIKHNVI
jgi:hypothetical protein